METIELSRTAQAEMNKIMASAVVEILRSVAETIREAKRVSAGTVYTALMTQGCTMQQYEQIEGLLLRSGVVRKANDELIWNA